MRTPPKAKKTNDKVLFNMRKNKMEQNTRKEFVIRRIPSVFMPCVSRKRHLLAYLHTPSGLRLCNLRYFPSTPKRGCSKMISFCYIPFLFVILYHTFQ